MDKSLRKFISYFTTGEKIALITAFLCGLVTHMYMFTNKIPNHDEMRYSFSYSNLVQDVYTANSSPILFLFCKIAKLIVQVVVTIANYVVSKLVVFRHNRERY